MSKISLQAFFLLLLSPQSNSIKVFFLDEVKSYYSIFKNEKKTSTDQNTVETTEPMQEIKILLLKNIVAVAVCSSRNNHEYRLQQVLASEKVK